jgi:hypothetical protein
MADALIRLSFRKSTCFRTTGLSANQGRKTSQRVTTTEIAIIEWMARTNRDDSGFTSGMRIGVGLLSKDGFHFVCIENPEHEVCHR